MKELNKKALWKISYGLYLINSHKEKEINGQIANTVFQVSNEPPRIAVSINKNCYTHSFITHSKTLSVSVLEQDTPIEFIGLFGFKCGKIINKFENIPYELGTTGCPIVKEHSLAVMEANVIGQADAGTHTVFIADVIAAEVVKDGEPLTYAYYQNVKKGKAHKNAPTFKEPGESNEALSADVLMADKGKVSSENNIKKGDSNMQKYVCKVCGYVYDPEKGDPDNNVKPGTKFEDIPDDWACPECGVGKDQFKPE